MNNYKTKQNIANMISDYASTDKSYGELRWDEHQDYIEQVVEKVINLGGFAAEVAKTVKSTIKSLGFGYYGAKCSSKQAWILACAVVDNNVELI
jgi:hypothetical protein